MYHYVIFTLFLRVATEPEKPEKPEKTWNLTKGSFLAWKSLENQQKCNMTWKNLKFEIENLKNLKIFYIIWSITTKFSKIDAIESIANSFLITNFLNTYS